MAKPNGHSVGGGRPLLRKDAPRTGAPTVTQVGFVERPTELRAGRFAAMKPERLSSILKQGASGDTEDWFDFVDEMLEKDAQLASLVETRIKLLTGSPWDMAPGRARPEDAQLAAEAAHACKEALQVVPEVERVFGDLAFGLFNGLSAAEHNWEFEGSGRRWLSYPTWRAPRLFRWGNEWQVQVRDRQRRWVDVPDGKFILHMPRAKATYPTRAALLRDVAWEWLFKFWAVYFWTSGAERLGNPPMVGTVEGNVDTRAKDKLRESLEKLSSGQAAVLELNTGIEFPDTGFQGSADVWERLVKTLDFAESKRIIGSTLNVEIGETGGAYAAADSQAAVTIRPRILADANALGGTIARDWCHWFLGYNRHLFGSRMPPVPTVEWDPDIGKPRPSEAAVTLLVSTGNMRVDELRKWAGQPELNDARGESFVQPLAKTPPPAGGAPAPALSLEAPDPPRGAGPRPFSRERRPRASPSTDPKTVQTSLPLPERTSPLRRALLGT